MHFTRRPFRFKKRRSKRFSSQSLQTKFTEADVRKIYDILDETYDDNIDASKNLEQIEKKRKDIFQKTYLNVVRKSASGFGLDFKTKRNNIGLRNLAFFIVATSTLPLRALHELSLYIFKNKNKSLKYGTGATLHQIQREQVQTFIKELQNKTKTKK